MRILDKDRDRSSSTPFESGTFRVGGRLFRGLCSGSVRLMLFAFMQKVAYHFYEQALMFNLSMNRYPPEGDSIGIPLTAFVLDLVLLTPFLLCIAFLPQRLLRLRGTDRPIQSAVLSLLLILSYVLLLSEALIHWGNTVSAEMPEAEWAAQGALAFIILFAAIDLVRCRPRRSDLPRPCL